MFLSNIHQKLSTRAIALKTDQIDELFRLIMNKQGIISFAVGAPDITLLPLSLLPALNRKAMLHYGNSILQYGMTQGFLPLREAILPIFEERGINCQSSEVHIATGGSGVLNSVCMALLNKGDTVLVETPTYGPALKTFATYDASVVSVACDDEGMLPDALEKELKKGQVKCIYLLPTFQNPVGRTMSGTRRKQISTIVKKNHTLVIEDDVYYDLRYRGEHIPAFYAYAPKQTIYLSSFSKTFAPAMRIGFTVMPSVILEKVLIFKQGIDMQTSSYTQALAVEFVTGGYAKKHLSLINKIYARKLRVMLQALKNYMPAGFTWNRPEGGMFLWVTGPKTFDAAALFPSALDAGVAYLPGNIFYVGQREGKNTMRLNFASPPQDKIEQGIKILADLCST